MELESTFSEKSSLRSEYLKQCCKPNYQIKWIKCKGAFLILTWSFLAMSTVYYYSISTSRDSINQKLGHERPKGSELIGMGSLLLIGGWLADSYFGRYKVICSGLWLMWIGSLLSAFSLVIAKVNTTYKHYGDMWVSLFSKLVMGSGFGLFQANIIQFGIDQLSEASSTEITSFITYYTLTLFISAFVMYFSASCTTADYVGVLVLIVCLTLAVCSYFLFNHVLVKEQIIQNPLPLIWKVVQYSIKNRHLQRRFSSFKDHSMLDIAKIAYAGPFSSEQVEDVKAFFRVAVIIISCSLPHSGTTSIDTIKDSLLPHLQNFPNESSSLSNCYKALTLTHTSFTFTLVLVLFYLTIIQPIFHNCIPKVNITTKFIIALVLFFIRIVAFLGIESASYQYQIKTNALNVTRCYTSQNGYNTVNIDIHWIIIPEIMNGLSLFILILTGLEFVCAQAPFNMKGLVFGITYALFSFGSLIQTGLLVPFHYLKEAVWQKAPLTCGLWYFLTQAGIVLISFMLMIMVIRRYKYRTRINILQSDWQEINSDN